MFTVNARSTGGKLTVEVGVSEVPDCSLVNEMAKEAKRSNRLLRAASVKCRGGLTVYN
ncbi:unnamed protein product [Cylicocyclus nassatus]|uniref:Uncharacterized protein n=1 Tax=Cylicocyclus nassatus TaxID=53992 RepID=A0AA36GQY9_CYLNA|nr:unnamed protein product [Cylicocyclus nassatus]